jgi:hypothetical protein
VLTVQLHFKPAKQRVPEGSSPRGRSTDAEPGVNEDGRGTPNEYGHVFPPGFEEDDGLRSAFVRQLVLRQAGDADAVDPPAGPPTPRTLVRYWHDPDDLPDDVRACLASWDRLRDDGFEVRTFDDLAAAAYIRANYTHRETDAFSRCRHPAMRSDYLRMCFILREGGLYIDADDVLVSLDVEDLVADGRLKLQPLCYDVDARAMAPTEDVWRSDLPAGHRIFYANNDPLAAAPDHPVLARALARATVLLLGEDPRPEIQSTTGPGNLTAALAAHARELEASGRASDFHFIRNWDAIAETRWELSYRSDARNWRNMDLS